jgi:pyrroloquinoline quinone biosynthesis protein B
VPPRSQPSLALSAGDGRWSLVNASPDVRDQLARFSGLHPRPGTRDVPLDTIVVTNADLDHTIGLLVLRESLPYRVITTPWIRNTLLDLNAAFRILTPAFGTVKIDEAFHLDREEQLEAKLFPLPGKVPTWAQPHAGNSPEATLGLRVVDRRSGKRLVYAPGIQRLDSATLAELAEADVRFVDGTFYTSDELRALRPGAPDAVTMGHVPISGPEGSLALLRGMRGRTLYTHINNTNPILDASSAEAASVRAAGV